MVRIRFIGERSILRTMNAGNDLADAIERLRLGRVGAVLGEAGGWIVGGVARALVAGTEPDADVDIAVDRDLGPLLERLGIPARRHDRFGTAVVPLDGGRHADIARTRTEAYPSPGALPDVDPAPIGDDLARRDFTVNAIAVAIAPPHDVLDPFAGAADLAAGRLRVLHRDSFRDDPTRAIRAARYCARLGLEPDRATLALLARADLGLVSADRRDAELRRLATERAAAAGFELLDRWGVRPLPAGAADLLAAVAAKRMDPLWGGHVEPAVRAILIAAGQGPDLDRARELATARPSRPSRAVSLAAGVDMAVLLVAAAAGGAWIERYLREWRGVGLEISGDDLLAAGVPRGPAIGAGLAGALDRKLDGELDGGREAELAAALEIAAGAG
jgi:tRNA nucleotidyltransferase (CCA-adding enzyme)